MDKSSLKGKRYIALVRVSNAKESDHSAEAQLELMRAFGDQHGMIYVTHIDESDVSGSFPVRREKLEQLIARKRSDNDFEVLLCQRLDRLTRSGPEHGFWFEFECKKAGIKLVFVADDIPSTYAGLIKVAKWEGSREQALATSQRSTQGYQYAVEKGTCITSSRTPFGCWRIYFTPEGQPSHIIRDLRDGRQQELEPTPPYSVIATLGELSPTRAAGRYKKQKQERVLLMPGDQDQVDLVRKIFDLHYRQGIGSKRIAGMLNDLKILSPNKRKWSQNQVESIYTRECYTGRSIGNRTTSAKFFCRNRNAPKRADIDEDLSAQHKYLPKRERPLEEWVIQDQPMMADFLGDPQLRELAIKGQEDYWRRRLDPNRAKRPVQRIGSEYLLTGLIFAKQDGEPLKSVLCGRPDNRIRYYRHLRGAREYQKGSIFNRMFPAKELEQAVVGFVQDALNATDDLEQRIRAAIAAQLHHMATENVDLAHLRQRRDALRKRIEFVVSNLDEGTLTEAKSALGKMREEIQTLDRQIESQQAVAAISKIDAATVAQRVRQRCQTLAASLADAPKHQLRALLRIAVEKVVADMETKAVEIHLALPNWIMEETPACPMRPATNSRSSVGPATHLLSALKIAVGDCFYISVRCSHVCYNCQRRLAA